MVAAPDAGGEAGPEEGEASSATIPQAQIPIEPSVPETLPAKRVKGGAKRLKKQSSKDELQVCMAAGERDDELCTSGPIRLRPEGQSCLVIVSRPG